MQEASVQAIIDTDPGLDDAIAILYALRSPAFEVLGLTTVAGNIGLAATTRNAGRLLALARRTDIPVVAGASRPLKRPALDVASHIHGVDGVGGVPLPQAAAPALDGAVDWMAEQLANAPDKTVDLLALGPLTNVATLVERHPSQAVRIRRLIAMGGAVETHGNVSARSEFNFAADPEAVETVLGADLPLAIVPLDVTRQVRATHDYATQLATAARPEARKAGELIKAYFKGTDGGESRPLHDPCVMLLAAVPQLFKVERRHLDVCLKGGDSGALVSGTHAVDVAMGVDEGLALAQLSNVLVGSRNQPDRD